MPQDETHLDAVPIQNLPGLSTRALNSLLRAGITTVGALARQSDLGLLEISNFGLNSLHNVKIALRRFQRGERASSTPCWNRCAVRDPSESPDIQKTQVWRLPGASARALNCLHRAGIKTVGDLAQCTDKDLMGISNLGVSSLANLKDALRRFARGERAPLAPDPVTHVPLCERGLVVPEAALGRPISDLELPLAMLNCLEEAGIPTIGDILALTERELLDVPGAGRNIVNAIGQALARWRPPPRSVSEVFELSTRVLTERDKDIISKRWGIRDGEPKTLEEVGQGYGVSRERIRQIEARALTKLARTPKVRRRVDPIQQIVEIADSCTEVATSLDDLLRHLRSSGLSVTAEEFRMIQFFLDLGWIALPAGIRVDVYSALPVVRGEEKLAAVLRLAQKHARNTGAANAGAVARELQAPDDETWEILSASPLFTSVEKDWFVLPEASAPFLSNVRLMHCYCGDRLPLRFIRAGLRKRFARHPEYRQMPLPPSEVIGAALATLPECCIVQGSSCWKIKDGIEEELELGGSIQSLLSLFDRDGPVLTYPEIREGLLAAGFASATADFALASPLVHKVEYGIYARVGVELSWDEVAAARNRRPPEVTAASSLTYSRTGVIHFEINVGGWAESGVVSSSHLDRLSGRWSIAVGGVEHGALTVRNNFAYGLTPAFETLGVRRGDRIRISFEVRRRVVDVTVLSRAAV